MKKRNSILCACIALFMTACALDGGNVLGPAGCVVFYDKGSYSDGWRYLEYAPEDAGKGDWETAIQRCEDYRYGGYDDWFLPDVDTLGVLLGSVHKGAHGEGEGKLDGEGYWSSSEEDADTALAFKVIGSAISIRSPQSKSDDYQARPVRRF